MIRHVKHRHGFTVFEVMIVSGLMVMLVMLLSAAWSGFGRPTVDLMARCQMAQEMNLAAAFLASDFGGSPPGAEARLGKQQQAQLVGWMRPTESQLWLCFDGGTEPNETADWSPPDTIVAYQVVEGSLLRQDQSTGLSLAVARNVDAMEVEPGENSSVVIRLKFKVRGLVRTYTLVARVP